jgi:hypothetical protein
MTYQLMNMRLATSSFRAPRALLLLLLAIPPLHACAPQDDQSGATDAGPTAPGQPSSLWQSLNDSAQVAVPDEANDAELQAAIAQARATDAEARLRWLAAPPEERARWFIKWAAPIAESNDDPNASAPGAASGAPRTGAVPATAGTVPGTGVEHVWVQPIEWSTFRIEGPLATKPTHDLACGKTANELVSFPVDELSDWIYLPDGDFHGKREGGFTVQVLERRFGKPHSKPK